MSINRNETIGEEVGRFIANVGKSEHTKRAYKVALGHFTDYLSGVGVSLGQSPSELTSGIALDFVTWLRNEYQDEMDCKLSQASLAVYLAALSGFYRHLVTSGCLHIDYVEYAIFQEELKKKGKFEPEPLEKRLPGDDLIDALVAVAKIPPVDRDNKRHELIWRRNLAIVTALKTTGARAAELVGLLRKDLDYSDHGAWVTGKGDKVRYVKFSEEAWHEMTTYLSLRRDGEVSTALEEQPVFSRHDKRADNQRLPLTTRSIQDIVTSLVEKAGVAEQFNMTPHRFRHWFATRLLRKTGNLALVQDALGHESADTTRRYAKSLKQDLVEAHGKVFDEG